MAISWDSIRSVVIFFAPILIPKAISYYRSIKNQSRRHGIPIQAVPPPVRVPLFLLAFLSFLLALKTLPFFAPENLFGLTQSRLQIPVDVLFARIATLRPEHALTAWDHALRAKFVNLESRLLYLQFGPEVVAECPFCHADEPKSYLYYALPNILWPHITNLVVITIATSPSWTGKHGGQWRTWVTIVAGVLGALDIYLVSSYNHQANSRALRLVEVDFFYWSMRTYRLLALAAVDAVLSLLIWLSATNRAFTQLPSPAERIEMVNRTLVAARSKMSALGILKNTAMRDEELRTRNQAYWQHEVRLMGEVMEEREVLDGVNDALSNRIDIANITREAEQYAQNVLKPLQQFAEDH